MSSSGNEFKEIKVVKENPPSYDDINNIDHLLKNIPKELSDDYQSIRNELKENHMKNHEARVCVSLDISYSMQNPNEFFKDKNNRDRVQEILNKALSLALAFDNDGKIEVFPFGGKSFKPVEITRDNFKNATTLILQSTGGMNSGTNYANPLKAIRTHYFSDCTTLTTIQGCKLAPVYALFVTDGEPNADITEANSQFRSSSYQAIFYKFIALRGKQEDQEFTFLKNLDDAKVKQKESDDAYCIDNSDLVVLNDPGDLKTTHLIKEYRPWVIEAHEKGVLTHNAGLDNKKVNVFSEGRITTNINGFYNNEQKNSVTTTPAPNPASCCIIL